MDRKARVFSAVRFIRNKDNPPYGLMIRQIKRALSGTSRRRSFFGFGLALGTEFMLLKELVGGDHNAFKLYKAFRDPTQDF